MHELRVAACLFASSLFVARREPSAPPRLAATVADIPDRIRHDGWSTPLGVDDLTGRHVRFFIDSTGALSASDTIEPSPRPALFESRALHASGPDGETVDAVSSQYAVTWYDRRHRRLRVLTRTVTNVPLTRSERAILTAEVARRAEGRGVSGLGSIAPRTRPAIQGLGLTLPAASGCNDGWPAERPTPTSTTEPGHGSAYGMGNGNGFFLDGVVRLRREVDRWILVEMSGSISGRRSVD
jgi:hypothetical protein